MFSQPSLNKSGKSVLNAYNKDQLQLQIDFFIAFWNNLYLKQKKITGYASLTIKKQILVQNGNYIPYIYTIPPKKFG